MRIALVSDCYLPEVNGISFCVQNLGKQFALEHTVFVAVPSYSERVGMVDDRVSQERFRAIHIPLDSQTQFVWPNYAHMTRWLRTIRPDVVHVHTLGVLGQLAILTCRKLGLPVVVTYHTLVAGTLASYPAFARVSRLAEHVAWWWSVRSCNQVDRVIAPASLIEEALLEHGVRKPIVVVPNGIETEIFTPVRQKEKSFTVLYVGRIGYEKGVDVLVEAARMTPDVQWLFVGDGPAREEISKTASANVHFEGAVPRAQLPAIYPKAHIFATAAQFEVNPLVVLEAMASGLPVLGVDKGGMRQLFTSGQQGYLYETVEPEQFARSIIELQQDMQAWKRMSGRARRWALERNVDAMATHTLEVYRGLLQQTKRDEHRGESSKERNDKIHETHE